MNGMRRVCDGIVGLVLAGVLLAGGKAYAAEVKSFNRVADPVIVTGEPLKEFWGRKIDRLRLYASQNGRLEPIPYQIDKRDPDNEFMISSETIPSDILAETGFDATPEKDKRVRRIREFERKARDYEKDVKEGKLPAEVFEELRRVAYFEENIEQLDYNDHLAFMARDAGSRVSRSAWPVKEGIEIELTDPVEGARAWAYLFYYPISAPPPSMKDYVQYDPAADKVTSQFGVFDFVDDKPMIIEQIVGRHADGTEMPNFVDRFKLRIKLKPIPLFCVSINFDENNTKSFTIGYKDGPVRVIRRNIFWITIAGVKLPGIPKAIIYYIFYDNALEGPTEIYNPMDPKYVLCDGSKFRAGIDMRKVSYGTELYTKDNRSGIVLDGVMSDDEKRLVLPDQTWIGAYNKNHNFGLMARMFFEQKLVDAGTHLDLYLLDDEDAEMKPDNEPGVHFVGYDIDLTTFPAGKFKMWFYIYIGPGLQKGQEKVFLHILDHPLQIRGSTPS